MGMGFSAARTTTASDGTPLFDRIRDIQTHGLELTDWEEEFIDDVSFQASWTEKQAEIIERIYRERAETA